MTLTERSSLRATHRTRSKKGVPKSAVAPVLAHAIEHLPLSSIKGYDNNARTHGDAQLTKLASTMSKVGFLVPILVDRTNTIVAGHGRWLAAEKLGMPTVPVIRADHLTSRQVQAFRVADNRLAELSSWDERTLALELKDLAGIELDPEILELTGFEIAEIDLRLDSLDESPPDRADIVALPDAGPSVSRLGDLWKLGAHRLICGSALDADTFETLMAGERARAVWSDPPYNVKISGHVSGMGKVKHREFAMASGEMSETDFTAFLARYLELAVQYSVAGSLHYVCMDAAHGLEVLTAARQASLRLKTTCTWAKTNAGMGSLYRQQTEFVHVFKNGGDEVSHLNNIQLGKYGRHRTTLWTYAGVNTFRKGRIDDLGAHPTVKPWALVADAIKDCSGIGDAVLDCFCGSGTTLIAAEKVRRRGFGIELDAAYVDVAVRRWQDLTGEPAVHAVTGQTFAEVEAERLGVVLAPAPEVGEAGNA